MRRNLLYVWTAGLFHYTLFLMENQTKTPIYLPAIIVANHPRVATILLKHNVTTKPSLKIICILHIRVARFSFWKC